MRYERGQIAVMCHVCAGVSKQIRFPAHNNLLSALQGPPGAAGAEGRQGEKGAKVRP